MTATTEISRSPPRHNPEKASALALRLAHAENALLTLTSGQVDAIVSPGGKTYLLHPAQEHLRKSERRLQTIMDSVADVITVVNRGGVIVFQSAAATRVLGCEPDELVGKNFFALIHEDDVPAIYSPFFNVIEGCREDATARFRHRHGDGTYCLLEATVGKLRDPSSSSVVLSLRPILRALPSDELGHATESDSTHSLEGGEAVEAASPPAVADDAAFHDSKLVLGALQKVDERFRTPLTLFYRHRLSYQEIADALVLPVSKVTSRMAQGEAQLRQKLASGEPLAPVKVDVLPQSAALVLQSNPPPRFQLQLESIDAHEAARRVEALCRPDAAVAQIELLLYLRAEEYVVQADWARLLEVMCHLVRNAFEFSIPGNTISIATLNGAPGRLTFELSDQGLGFEAGESSQVFSAHSPSAVSQPRFRAGLQTARRLAEAQGGTLTASSAGRSRGVTFRLTLRTTPPPQITQAIVPTKEPEVPPPALMFDPLYILLVGDSGNRGLGHLIEGYGHAFFSAPDLRSGLALGENCRFDLLVSDVTLPDGSGYELLEQLRLTQTSMPGISLSSSGTPADREKSRSSGFCDHLVKPVSFESLRSAMQKVVEERRERGTATVAA